MGTLPSLTKTWRFRVNEASAGGVNPISAQNLMWAIKDSLIGNGAWTDSAGAGAASAGDWTVVSSSNSVDADATDRWAAAANLVWAAAGVAHSWIVLQQTGIGASFQLLIDLTNATTSNAYIAVSPGGLYVGGTTTNRPTATDEVRLCNTASWGGLSTNTASTLHVLRSTDGACTRVFICRSGFVSGYWIVDALSDADSSLTVPFAGFVSGDSASATDKPLVANLAAVTVSASSVFTYAPAFGDIPANAAACYFGGQYSRQFGSLYAQVVANDIGASWPMNDMCVYSEQMNAFGWIGKVFDQWWVSTALANSDTFPGAGTRNFAVFGDIAVPWNTTAVTIGGGASTPRDGEHAGWTYYADKFLMQVTNAPNGTSATLPIVPVTVTVPIYIMQANDSVTGTRYDWRVTGSPDWAGVNYPGPNAASNVSVAGARIP